VLPAPPPVFVPVVRLSSPPQRAIDRAAVTIKAAVADLVNVGHVQIVTCAIHFSGDRIILLGLQFVG
jgi:hypothetical protein